MKTNRLEALSDGMIAIIITIMVLEMRPPESADLASIIHLGPVLLIYTLSFVMLGIYWNNHHHLFQVTKEVNASIMWGNLHLMFWLSLIPFATNWVGEQPGEAWPTAIYGIIMIGAGIAYTLMQSSIVAHHRNDTTLTEVLGNNSKGMISMGGHILATIFAFYNPWISYGLFAAVALMWVVPDRRIEGSMREQS